MLEGGRNCGKAARLAFLAALLSANLLPSSVRKEELQMRTRGWRETPVWRRAASVEFIGGLDPTSKQAGNTDARFVAAARRIVAMFVGS